MRLLVFLFGATTTLAGADILGFLEPTEPESALFVPEHASPPILDARPVLYGRPPETCDPGKVDAHTTRPPRGAQESIVKAECEIEEENEPEEFLPPPSDPPEAGRSRLVLGVRAEGTDTLLDTHVQLWRLGAPGNDDWTSGDRLQTEVEVSAGFVTVDDLPEGQYRAVCSVQRAASADPPAFTVQGRLTRALLHVPLPRTFRVGLRVVDGYGWPIARLEPSAHGKPWGHMATPRWVQPRALREPERYFGRGCSCGIGRGSPLRWDPAVDFQSLLWGEGDEDSRSASGTRDGVEVAGNNTVVLRATGDALQDRTYLAVSMPLETMVARVRLPDGRPLSAVVAEVWGTCHAVLVTDPSAAGAWRRLHVNVRVHALGHHPLEFAATPDDPSPAHTLECEPPRKGGSG
jgi:hypothetical protein